jgi:hypothetical protein
MTEVQWLDAKWTPAGMLHAAAVHGASDRKLRLFGCACCRLRWDLLPDDSWRWAVEASECYADGRMTRKALQEASAPAYRAWHAGDRGLPVKLLPRGFEGAKAVYYASRPLHDGSRTFEAMAVLQCLCLEDGIATALIRCVFGNPFRPVDTSGAWWRDPEAVRLAQAIYAGPAFADLPVLADRLEEAGCADAEVLGHCRGAGPHGRGCWVVDYLLDRS